MARWTITLRELVSMSGGIPDDGYAKSYAALGLDGYPIYDETHRSELNAKIVRHYFMREIGAETIPMFRLYMDEAMRLIMPGYNKLYQSALLDVQHFAGVTRAYAETIARDMSSTGSLDRVRSRNLTGSGSLERTRNGSSNNVQDGTTHRETSGANSNETKFLDTAQGAIKNLDDGYLTWVQKDSGTDSSSTDGTSSNRGSETNEERQTDGTTHKEDVKESQGDATRGNEQESTDRKLTDVLSDPDKLLRLESLVSTLLNIDRMVVNDKEVAQCFMGIW